MKNFYVYRRTFRPISPDLAFYSYYKGIAAFHVKQNIEPKYFLGRMTNKELTNFCSSCSQETRVPRLINRRKKLV